MQTTRKIKAVILNTTILIALLFLCGTQMNAQTSYTIFATPTSLSFTVKAGAAASTKTIKINDTTPGPLPFTLSADQPWITMSATAGNTKGGGESMQFGVNPAGLAVGSYSGHVYLTASGVANSPQAVPVTLIVTAGKVGTVGTTVAPAIMTQPSSKTVTAGQAATFSVTATGSAPMTYQWRMNGAAISGAVSSSYTTPAETTANNNAQFTATVTNSMGNATSNAAILTVNAAATTTTTYTINATPASLSFSMQAGGAASTKSVMINDTTPGPLPFTLSADQPWITMNATSGNTKGGGETMQFGVNPAGLAAGSYTGHVYLTASGVANSPQAVPVTLTVTSSAAVAPAITTQPASQTIATGKTATFNVAATGTAPMTYQWNMNGAAISGATSSTYTTPAETTSNNSQQFTVAVSNSAGSATSSPAVLTVTAAAAVAPSITTQPASQTVASGKTATFSVAATGTAPMTYQWSMGGTPISGATSSTYTTPAETASNNNAQFTVAVSNAAGNVTSNAATLTVTSSTLTLNSSVASLNFGSVSVSTTSTQTVTLTNAGNASVTISNVTVSGAGFNANGVSSGVILTPGQSTTLTATFDPSATGAMTGSIMVASNATNSPDSIALSGTGVAAVSHSASLAWTASTSSVIGYNMYSGTTSGGPYTKLTSSPIATTTYTDSIVQAGLTYYYVVTSVATGNEESGYSNQITAVIP